MVVELAGIRLVDPRDTSRSSASQLQVVSSRQQDRAVALLAEGVRGTFPPGQPAWTVGAVRTSGRQAGVSLRPGLYQVTCTAESGRRTAVLEVFDGTVRRIEVEAHPDVRRIARVLNAINQALHAPEGQGLRWQLNGRYETYFVEQTRSPYVRLTQELVLSGRVGMNYRMRVPGWSISIPYLEAGVFVEPDVQLDVDLTARCDSRQNPARWYMSGGPSLRGSIRAGVDLRAGDLRFIGVNGEISGRIAASGSGRLGGPPLRADFQYRLGELTARGYVQLIVLRRPWVNYYREITIWEGLNGSYSVDLADLMN